MLVVRGGQSFATTLTRRLSRYPPPPPSLTKYPKKIRGIRTFCC